MNQTLQDVLDQFQNRYTRNISYLEKHQPELHRQLANLQPQHTDLNLNQNGLEVIYHGQPLYNGRPAVVCEQQANEFIARPDTYAFSLNTDKAFGEVQNEFLQKLFSKAEKYQVAMNRYRYDGRNVPLLFVMGVSVGFHVVRLLQQLDIRQLIIYEPDPELLQLSLYTIEWEGIFQHFAEKNGTIHIHTGNPDEAYGTAIDQVSSYNKFFSVVSFYFTHYNSPEIDQFTNHIKSRINTVMAGIGFYDDEKLGLKHTLQNIRSRYPILNRLQQLQERTTAFIVGSGPSCNKDIENIKKHRDKILLISCGTSLGILLQFGLTPDLHFEMERSKFTSMVLSELDEAEKLKQLDLIAFCNVEPQAISFFREARMTLKQNDAGSNLFPEKTPKLEHSNPTVTNMACSLMTHLGVETIYLFGFDMGSKQKNVHHAFGTVHTRDNATENRKNLDQTWWNKSRLQKTIPGNFGGEVHTTHLYMWCINSLRALFGTHPDTTVYNCSDGAVIPNTLPLHSDKIKIHDDIPDRSQVIEQIKQGFDQSVYEHINPKSIQKDFFEQLEKHKKTVLRILAEKVTDRSSVINQLNMAYLYLASDTNDAPRVLLAGTTNSLLAFIYAYTWSTDEINQAFYKDAINLVREFLEFSAKDILEIFQVRSS